MQGDAGALDKYFVRVTADVIVKYLCGGGMVEARTYGYLLPTGAWLDVGGTTYSGTQVSHVHLR